MGACPFLVVGECRGRIRRRVYRGHRVKERGGDSRGAHLARRDARPGHPRERTGAWVGVVERGADGRPQVVRSLEKITLERGSVIDASWTTSTGLVFVARDAGGGDDQLVTMPLGGLPAAVSLPIRVTSMSAGASFSSVVITGTDEEGNQQVLVRSGALWQNAPEGFTSARYAG